MAKTFGPLVRKTEIQRVRCVFKWAYDQGLIDRPIRYGPAFKAPPKRVLQKARVANGTRDDSKITTTVNRLNNELLKLPWKVSIPRNQGVVVLKKLTE